MLENKNVSEIIKLIQSKQISVKEVVEFYIARIETVSYTHLTLPTKA